MKTLKLAAVGLLAIASVFTGCEDDGTVIPGPTLNIISPTESSITVAAGGTFDVEVTASTNDKLESFVIEKVFAGDNVTVLDSTLDNGTTSYTYNGTLDAPTVEGTALFNFTCTNNKGGSTTKSLEVVVANLSSGTESGEVWNVQGPNKGAWNLVDDVAVSSSGPEAEKDLKDNTNGTTFIFDQTWTSGNGTMFVRDNSLNFSTASLSDVINAYGDGSPVATTPTLSDGDIVIARNDRFPKGYVLIRVDEVTNTLPAGTPGGDNLDNITFTYRK